ncbi:MAG: prepilin-type N-terminal cleavage/methylation domain-containing protein [Phycisphaerales bacterium]|nr:prepilin-type N-terminal cleavage/methylation domain-containing protein [Phycisphaerales bacterium]
MRHHHSHMRAFSLIELLVALCITMMLVGLLLPALATTRDASIATTCASNQHQIGLAVTQFAGDHFDLLPREGISPWAGSLAESKYIPWVNAIQSYIAHPGGRTDLASPILLDPAHPNPNHQIQYVVNGIGFPNLPRGLDVVGSDRRPASPLSLLHRPTEMMYLTAFTEDADNSIALNALTGDLNQDAGLYDVWNLAHLLGPDHGSDSIARSVRRVGINRHGNGNNVLFADGHVDARPTEFIQRPHEWYDGLTWTPDAP